MEQHDETDTAGPAESAEPADSRESSIPEPAPSAPPSPTAGSHSDAGSSPSAGAASSATKGSVSSMTPGSVTKGKVPNNVRRHRIERMMSKAELARRANLSVLTIDRVEKGFGCRMDSKRKILEALGLSLADRVRVFGEEE